MKTMEDLRVSLKQCDEDLMLVKKERDEAALKVFFLFSFIFPSKSKLPLKLLTPLSTVHPKP